jgi:hypothetical protein
MRRGSRIGAERFPISFLCHFRSSTQSHDPIKTPVQLVTAITQPATALCLARPVTLLLLSFTVGLASMQPCAATPFEWEYTGSLKTARFHHTATLLPDGRVLVAGGEDQKNALASAELYDPATGTWSVTGSLNTARDSHTATLLPNGMVLVAEEEKPYPASVWRARKSMIQPPVPGLQPVASTPGGYTIPQLFCPTAWCSSREDRKSTASF